MAAEFINFPAAAEDDVMKEAVANDKTNKMADNDNMVASKKHGRYRKYVECKVCFRQLRPGSMKRHMQRQDHIITILNNELKRVQIINSEYNRNKNGWAIPPIRNQNIRFSREETSTSSNLVAPKHSIFGKPQTFTSVPDKNTFRCSSCHPIGGGYSGMAARYHDYRCATRKRYEKDAAFKRYNDSSSAPGFGFRFQGPPTRDGPLEVYIYKIKMGNDTHVLIKNDMIREENLSYARREALELYRHLSNRMRWEIM